MTQVISSSNLFLLILLSLLLNMALFAWIIKTELRLKKVFRGQKADSLENTLSKIAVEIKDLQKSGISTSKYLETVEKRLRRSIQGLDTKRFKAFSDFGGNQNFASAFLDEDGSGLVISSLATRDHFSIFAKPIKNWKSEHELTDEESEVLQKAKVKASA